MRTRSRRVAPCAVVCALGMLVAVAQPVAPVRVVAEWEPALGALISWPLGIPRALVEELARDDMLYVLVTGPSAQNQAQQTFNGWGIDPARVEFITASVQTKWTRDWGPHQIFDGTGQWSIVDPIFEGYPWVPTPCQTINSPGGYSGDDAVNSAVAAHFGATLHAFPAYLTGGNFLVDGHATAFSTCAMVGENEQLGTAADFLDLAEQFLGVRDYHVLDNTEDFGIQHIDCWFKPLDEETLLVKLPPPSHEEYARIQDNLRTLALAKTRYDRPYRIVRVDTPAYDGYNVAAYTNSLILNGKIFVPLFGVPGDADAIATFEAAMPGYDVIGFPWGSWYYYDALHCRTRAIFDRYMLRITHRRLPAWVSQAAQYEVRAFIDDRSGAGLVPSALGVHWREAGAVEWNHETLTATGETDVLAAMIPGPPPGVTVEYYIAAADQSGRSETLPRTAPAGAYAFTVGCQPILLDVRPTRLVWTAVAGAIGYDVVRGDLDLLHETGGDLGAAVEECVVNDRAATHFPYAEDPAPGRGSWFLVRAVAPSGDSTYAWSTDCERTTKDAQIDVAVASCP